jgi:hypothetical protein
MDLFSGVMAAFIVVTVMIVVVLGASVFYE